MQGTTRLLSISSDSKFIATYHDDLNIRIYDVENKLIMGQIFLNREYIANISFTNSDKNIVVNLDSYVCAIDFSIYLDKFLITKELDNKFGAHLNNGMVAYCNRGYLEIFSFEDNEIKDTINLNYIEAM